MSSTYTGFILRWDDPLDPEVKSIYTCMGYWSHPSNGAPPKIYANRHYAQAARATVTLAGLKFPRDEIAIIPVTITHTPEPAPPSFLSRAKDFLRAISL